MDLSGKLTGTVTGMLTPHVGWHSQMSLGSSVALSSHQSSPSGPLDSFSTATRSIPATPLSIPNGNSNHLSPSPGTSLTPDGQNLSGHLSSQGNHHLNELAKGNIQPSFLGYHPANSVIPACHVRYFIHHCAEVSYHQYSSNGAVPLEDSCVARSNFWITPGEVDKFQYEVKARTVCT